MLQIHYDATQQKNADNLKLPQLKALLHNKTNDGYIIENGHITGYEYGVSKLTRNGAFK